MAYLVFEMLFGIWDRKALHKWAEKTFAHSERTQERTLREHLVSLPSSNGHNFLDFTTPCNSCQVPKPTHWRLWNQSGNLTRRNPEYNIMAVSPAGSSTYLKPLFNFHSARAHTRSNKHYRTNKTIKTDHTNKIQWLSLIIWWRVPAWSIPRCPFLAVHNSSIGDLVTDWVTESLTNFYFIYITEWP